MSLNAISTDLLVVTYTMFRQISDPLLAFVTGLS